MSRRVRITLAALLAAWWCSAEPLRGTEPGPVGSMSKERRALADEYNRRSYELLRAGDWHGGLSYAQKIVTEFPGRMEVVRPALGRMLWTSGPMREWAWERIVALHRSGDLPASDGLVYDAYLGWVSTLAARGEVMRAAKLIDEFGRETGRDLKWRYANARMHYGIGSFDAPRLMYEVVVDLQRHRDDPKFGKIVEVFWPTERNSGSTYLQCARAYRPGPLSVAAMRIRVDEDAKWFISPKRPLRGMAGVLDRLIAESLGQVAPVVWNDEANAIDPWYAVDQQLLGRKPGELAELRKVQDAACRSETGRVDLADLPAEKLLAIYRRYPWARSGQRALIAYGQKLLWAGRPRVALRSFRDALSHAVDPGLRDAAQTSVWLARAQGRSLSDLGAAFEGVDPGKTFTWMGRAAKAGEIRRELSAGLADPPAPRPGPILAKLAHRSVRVPAIAPWPISSRSRESSRMPWPIVDMQFAGENVVVSAPNVLAVYSAADCRTPLWQRTARSMPNLYSWMMGWFRPHIANGLIYTRWGYREFPTDVAAVDVRTGRLDWCTTERPTWSTVHDPRSLASGIRPLSDPVHVEGRLYVLGCASSPGQADRHRRRSDRIVSLFCLDAANGARVWETPLWPAHVGWSIQAGSAGIDQTTWFSMPVTVHAGAVYCVSNAGQVARCDLRDGRLEWHYEYPRTARGRTYALGIKPIIVGDKVIVRPRDHGGIFALDRRTGGMIWHNPFIRPAVAMGIVDGALLVHGTRTIASLDSATGKTRWFDTTEGWILGPGKVIGKWIYSGTSNALTRRDVRTGAVVERLGWPKGGNVQSFAIRNDTLYTVSDEACPVDNIETGRPLNPRGPAKAPKLTLPLEQAWQVEHAEAELHVPPPEAGLDGKVYLISGSVMECLDATPRGVVNWRRFIRPGSKEVWFHDGKLFLMHGGSVEVHNARTGSLLTTVVIPVKLYHTTRWRLGSMWLCKGSTAIGAIDALSGRVLWQANFGNYAGRGNWAPAGQPYWDGKNVHMLTPTWGDTNLTQHLVIAGSDGRIVSTAGITPAGDGRPTTAIYSKGRCIFAVDKKRVYRYALDGKQAAELPNAPTGSTLAAYDSPFILLDVSDRAARTKYQLVLRDDDSNYSFRLDNDFVGKIRDGRLSAMSAVARQVRIVDLARKKEVTRCQLPAEAKGKRHKRFPTGRFWQTGGTLSVLSTVDTQPRLDVFDAASGAHKGGQVFPGVGSTSRLWRSSQKWPQVVQVGGMLLVVDQAGLHAWTAAHDRKNRVRFLPESAQPSGDPLPENRGSKGKRKARN